jgi:glycosyltransferase involved in cell wall biosynthesis
MMGKNPFVSIVVPTYNRVENLQKCLNHLINLDYSKKLFEIIIIDDGSKDNTWNFLKEFSKKYKFLNIFTQKNSGPAKARNLGIKNSRGEIIFFVDDDVLVHPDFINKSLKWYKNKKVWGVGGNVFPEKLSFVDKYYIARYLDEYFKPQIWGDYTSGKGLATALCSYRKVILKQLNGFDESFPLAAGEDIELTRRVLKKGHLVIKDPSIQGEHLRSETFKSIFRLKFKRMSGAILDNKRKDFKEKSPYRFSRISEQWRNFKIAKKNIFKEKVTTLDFIKFIYLTLGLFISAKFGEVYYKRKLK